MKQEFQYAIELQLTALVALVAELLQENFLTF